ncbi:ATP-binding cassette domain-containing protein [Bosea sp. NPDC055353]
MLWGVDGITLYNDAYSEFAGLRQPLTLTLPARRAVGLIGHNGSGKSTLVMLLARQHGSAGLSTPPVNRIRCTRTREGLRENAPAHCIRTIPFRAGCLQTEDSADEHRRVCRHPTCFRSQRLFQQSNHGLGDA